MLGTAEPATASDRSIPAYEKLYKCEHLFTTNYNYKCDIHYICFCVCTYRCVVFWHWSVTLVTTLDLTPVPASNQWDPTRFKMFLCFSSVSPYHEFRATKFVLRLLIMCEADRYVSLLDGTADSDPYKQAMHSYRP